MPRGAAVIPYNGKRGTVWRIKYADAEGRQAGVVFRDEASALERRLLGVEDPGRKSLEPAPLSGEA